jgi:hypothetical protein
MPTAKAELAELAQRVDKVWAARLEQPDPLLQGCQREEVSWVCRGGGHVRQWLRMGRASKGAGGVSEMCAVGADAWCARLGLANGLS